MDIDNMSNDELLSRTHKAINAKRACTAQVVAYFQEISDRKLYLARGFPNLYEMVTKQFGFCAGSAMRRINSMRLIRDVPQARS